MERSGILTVHIQQSVARLEEDIDLVRDAIKLYVKEVHFHMVSSYMNLDKKSWKVYSECYI